MSSNRKDRPDARPGNALTKETSPYLLQHKDNPVHWFAWGDAAFERAHHQNKPILLSVGYAACHWCHVMAHESFEDAETAELMNAHFISVKVDREERPDVDRIYMSALHALGQQGGWPLTMFLTPELKPFWGGTYFPPESKFGRPGFRHVLTEIARIWRDEPEKIAANASAILDTLDRLSLSAPPAPITLEDLERHATAILNAVDPVRGGLNGAPKFPQAPLFDFLRLAGLRHLREDFSAAVDLTFRNISQGGIYDHLGGGLARYSVDPNWHVPHFEKMLYDNAMFVSQATRLWLETGSLLYKARVEETVNFVLGAMTTPEGLFVSSFDADSEGEEGKFYVWSKTEIDTVLGSPRSQVFNAAYNVTAEGNWEGQNILHRPADASLLPGKDEELLADCRTLLRSVRSRRVWPARDDKALADWNGLMIAALAEAGFVFDRPDWIEAAETAMASVSAHLVVDSRLAHSFCSRQARHAATADDYANLIRAVIALHMATGSKAHIRSAESFLDATMAEHWDGAQPGFFFSSSRADGIIARQKTIYDDATPAANGTMIRNLVCLYQLTGQAAYHSTAEKIFDHFAGLASSNPFAAPSFLSSCYDILDPIQLVACGKDHEPLLRQALYRLGLDVLVLRLDSANSLHPSHPAFAKQSGDMTPTLFICRGKSCSLPIRDVAGLAEALEVLKLTRV